MINFDFLNCILHINMSKNSHDTISRHPLILFFFLKVQYGNSVNTPGRALRLHRVPSKVKAGNLTEGVELGGHR